MCCNCIGICWSRKAPLFYSLLIPLTLILLFVYFCSQHGCLLLPWAVCIIGLWWLLVYSFFPKIVVTIKNIKDIEEFKKSNEFKNLGLYVDGRCVYNTANARAKANKAKLKPDEAKANADTKANKTKAEVNGKANEADTKAKADNTKAKLQSTAGDDVNNNAKDDANWPPTQFAFYVWKRGNYQLLLVLNNNESVIETANTYEHAVCNVVFGNNAKGD